MRGIAGALFALVLLFTSRAAVRADEPKPPPKPEEAAAEVAKAFAAKDQAGLAALAKRDQPDPWQVADALMLKGQREAADAFARAAPREDVKWLPDFISAWRDTENDKAARATVEKLNAAMIAKHYEEALAAAEAAPTGAMPYLRLRCSYGKGLALANLGRSQQAADIMRAVETECEVIGWYARGAAALWEATYAERRANRRKEALAAAERLLALQTRRGDRTGIGTANVAVGSALSDAGRWDDVDAAFKRALEVFRETGDRPRQVSVMNSLAWTGYRRFSLKDLEDWAMASLAISEPAGMWSEAARSHGMLALGLQDVGRMTSSAKRYRAALEFARKADDYVGVAQDLHLIGSRLGDAGEHEQALEPLQDAVAANEALKPPRTEDAAVARARRGWSLAALGRAAEARPEIERALEVARTSKDPWVRGMTSRAHGRLLRAEGGFPEAVKAYEEALLHLQSGDGAQIRLTQLELAETHRDAKDSTKARTLAEAALADAGKNNDQWALFHAKAFLARLPHDQGETQAALALAREARAGFQELAEARMVGEMDALIATLEAAPPPK